MIGQSPARGAAWDKRVLATRSPAQRQSLAADTDQLRQLAPSVRVAPGTVDGVRFVAALGRRTALVGKHGAEAPNRRLLHVKYPGEVAARRH